MAISSGNPAFDASALASEQLRQQEIHFAELTDLGRPAVGAAPTPLQLDHNRASIAHYRRLIASAIATGASTSTYVQALQSLGASLYA